MGLGVGNDLSKRGLHRKEFAGIRKGVRKEKSGSESSRRIAQQANPDPPESAVSLDSTAGRTSSSEQWGLRLGQIRCI